jgi:hypothetical protein
MTRYVAGPRLMDAQPPDYCGQVLIDRAEPLTVIEAPGRYTGLLDANGTKLYAQPEPIGFRVRD